MLFKSPTKADYISDLEDEVMTLRAQLQAMTRDRDAAYKRGWDEGRSKGWGEGWDAATEAHLGDQPLCDPYAKIMPGLLSNGV